MKILLKSVIPFALLAIISSYKKNSNPVRSASAGAGAMSATSKSFDCSTNVSFNSNTAYSVKLNTLITIRAAQVGIFNSISIDLIDVPWIGTISLNKDSNQRNGTIECKDYNKPSDTAINYCTYNSKGVLTGGGSVVVTKAIDNQADDRIYG